MIKNSLFFIILLISAVAFGYDLKPTEGALEGISRIQTACEHTQKADYIAEFNPKDIRLFANSGKAMDKGVVYRQFTQDGILHIRMDLLDAKGKTVLTLLKNEDGEFVYDAESKKTARGGHFLPICYFEEMALQPFPAEMKRCTYSSAKTGSSRGKTRITARFPEEFIDNEMVVVALTGITQALADIKKKHPFVREYLIDDLTNTILEIKKYNYNGKILFHRKMIDPVINPDWKAYPAIFNTPEKIDFEALNLKHFFNEINQNNIPAAPRSAIPMLADSLFRWGTKYGMWIFSGLGCTCLLAVFWLKHHLK